MTTDKEQRVAHPYTEARCHLKATPQNSTDCYITMLSRAEHNPSTKGSSLESGEREEVDNGGASNFAVGSVPNEYIQLCPQVKITNEVGGHTGDGAKEGGSSGFESSLEFGGAIETSLEFGGARGTTSLDFAATSKLCHRSRSLSPKMSRVGREKSNQTREKTGSPNNCTISKC